VHDRAGGQVGGTGVVWPFGQLTTGRPRRRTWSKKAGPVTPPSEMDTGWAPVSAANSYAYRFHDDHEVSSASISTTVSSASTAVVCGPGLTAYSRSAPSRRAWSDPSLIVAVGTQQMARSMLPSATRAACACDGITQASTRSWAVPAARRSRSGGFQFT
jgi:hypothetical protein